MQSNKSLTRVLLARAIAIALMTGGAAVAQTTAPTGSAASARAMSIAVDIPAQPLASALEAFAQQTGLQVVFATDHMIANERSPAIVGTLSPDTVMQRMLANSRLEFVFVNDKTVTIMAKQDVAAGQSRAAAAPAAAAPAPQASQASVATPVQQTATPGSVSTTLEAVTVTGTNLREIDPASPLLVIDSELIESRGYTSVEDVLRHLPQNLASKSSVSASLGEAEFGDIYSPFSSLGSSAVNLRGLGSRSTLVLVDGRRRAGSAQSQGGYTDISSIPLAQVERIEVLSDGASAIYGSDAVAGVVNIVLKKGYNATVLQARMENSGSGGDSGRVDATHSFGWDTGNLMLTAGLQKAKPADIRQFIHVGPTGIGDFTDIGGVNARVRNMGQPGVVYESLDYGISYHFLGEALGIIPGGQDGKNFNPNSLRPYNPDNAPSFYETGRIGPKTDSTSLRISGEQQLGGNGLLLTYGVGYTRQKNTERWHPGIFDFNFLEDGFATYVPASNPNNTFGEDVMVSYSYGKEFERITLSEQQEQKNLDYNVGLAGKLDWRKGWDYHLTYSGGSEKGRTDSLGDLTGSFGETGYARTQAVLDGLNVFGDGSNAAIVDANVALIQSLVERSTYLFNSRSHSVDLLLRGDLFSLPAGDVQSAVGAQYRTEDYSFYSSLGNTTTDSKRDVKAVFAEVGIPLLKDVPYAKELTLTLAARHEKFDQQGNGSLQDSAYHGGVSLADIGGFDIAAISGLNPGTTAGSYGVPQRVSRSYSNTSPLARLSWKPFDGLRLRSTWGRSFLTPQAQQQFGILYLDNRTFPIEYNGGQLPEGVTSVIALRGPNNDLKPQVATVKTFGFDWTPSFVKGLTLSSTYNDTNFDNYIGDPLSGISYADVFADLSQFPQGTFTVGKNGVMLWDARAINFLGRRSRSIDVNASYFTGTRIGDIRIEFNATRTLELSSQSIASQPVMVFSDSELGPSKWAADLSVGWEDGNYFASVASHYSASHRVLHPLSAQGTIYNDFIPNPNPLTRSASYTTWDAQIGYRTLGSKGWSKGFTARLGVQNAFNRQFPFVDNLYGFVSNRVDVRGRVIYFDLKKEF